MPQTTEGHPGWRGHTLVEALCAIALLALFTGFIGPNVLDSIERARVDEDVADFARTLRRATEQAVFRNRNYVILIEVIDGYYTIYEADSEGVIAEDAEPLLERSVLDRVYIDEIEHEDGSHQYGSELVLHATPEGWKSSVLLVLLDPDERIRFLRCDRLTSRVAVSRQPLFMLPAKSDVAL
ncbi:MAG: hypothetical protein ACTSX7_08655 [Alphaproteobacteria bacterium]